MTDGFELILNDYCAYCPDFSPEVEKIDCSTLSDGAPRVMTQIRCENYGRCDRIVENIGRKRK